MAISINPSTLSGAGLAAQKAARDKLQGQYNAALRNRQLKSAAVKRYANSTDRAQGVSLRQYDAAIAQERRLKGALANQTGTYTQFGKDLSRFNTLDQGNGTLDSVLNQLMPFDPQSASERLAAQQGLNSRLLQIKTNEDDQAQNYTAGVRQLDTEQPNRYRELLNNFAGRGMAYSSGYGNAFGQEAADAAQRRSTLDSANQQGQAQSAVDRSGAQADFLSQIGSILYGSTSRLAGDAGNLGMAGNADLPLLLELARRRLTAAGSG